MGQTLPHGVYLPDNGERNCYTGLSQNWQKLDNLIGSHGDTVSFAQTLTEGVEIGKITINGVDVSLYHTDYSSDIASKANASDVYTKAEVDASLSEKADKATTLSGYGITDAYTKAQVENKISELVNSAPETLDTLNELASALGNDPNFATTIANQIGTKANDSDVVHIKGSDDIIDSKTFISLYTQSSGPSLWMKNTSFTMGTAPTTNRYSGIWVQDSNGTDTAYIVHQANKNNSQNLKFSVSNNDGSNTYQNALTFQGKLDGTFNFYSDNPANLGTSSNKWKTINGINPGALSLPNIANDINIDTTNWKLTGVANTYTPTSDGYICLRVENTNTSPKITWYINSYNTYSDTKTISTTGAISSGFIPVIANTPISILITATSIKSTKFYPCVGNV